MGIERTMDSRIEVLTSREELEDFASTWERLFSDVSDASPYLCPEWVLALCRHEPGSRGPAFLRVCVFYDKRGVAAILPFVVERSTERPFPRNELCWMGNGWAPRETAIVSERFRNQPFLEEALKHLLKADGNWTLCRLTSVPASSPIARQHASGFIKRTRDPGASVVIDLPVTWEEYRASLSKAHRKNLSRRTNQIRRLGEVRLQRWGPGESSNATSVEELLEAALTVSRRSWQADDNLGTAISDDVVSDFFTNVSVSLAARGRLDLSVLYVANRPVSFIWGAARWPRTTIAKLAFDRELAPVSPGLVHLAMSIEDSIARHCKNIDFGHEFASYKSKWSKRSEELLDLSFYPPGLLPRAVRFWFERPAWMRKPGFMRKEN